MDRIGRWPVLALGIGLLPGCIVIPVKNHTEEVHYHHHGSPLSTEPAAEEIEVEESDLEVRWGEGNFSETLGELTGDL